MREVEPRIFGFQTHRRTRRPATFQKKKFLTEERIILKSKTLDFQDFSLQPIGLESKSDRLIKSSSSPLCWPSNRRGWSRLHAGEIVENEIFFFYFPLLISGFQFFGRLQFWNNQRVPQNSLIDNYTRGQFLAALEVPVLDVPGCLVSKGNPSFNRTDSVQDKVPVKFS